MLTIRSPLFSFLLVLLLGVLTVEAAPQNNNNRQGKGTGNGRNRNGNGNGRNRNGAQQNTPQQQAAQVPQGLSQATDGSVIMDSTARVNGVNLRFKVSAPANQFTVETGVPGGNQDVGAQGAMGINVLLHGDGGQSFFDFPNQAVQGGLMGVVVLAPSENLLWGQRTGPAPGLQRADGVADAQAVNDLIQNVLPQVIAFNQSNVFMTGVSGGALMLSGFFVPAHMTNFAGTGVMLMCASLAPQVDFVDAAKVLSSTRIHHQTTKNELTSLQAAIPEAILAYEQAATGAGLNNAQINALQTVDGTPNGGHCAFDEQGFVSGIQLISDNYANIMQGGNGAVAGINAATVLTGVVGNENVQFA